MFNVWRDVCVLWLTCGKVRGQFVLVFSLLPYTQRVNSDLQPWQQAPLPSEPSHWPNA